MKLSYLTGASHMTDYDIAELCAHTCDVRDEVRGMCTLTTA